MDHQAPAPHANMEARASARFSFDVSLVVPPREAIELFTPEGERAWADRWDPIYVNTSDVHRVGAGTVFTTSGHGIRRVWIIDTYDRSDGVVRYTVFTPGRNVTRIEARISPRAGGSVAQITYERTSLNASADAEVRVFGHHAARMQVEWQNAINALHPQ
jgi:hypothetical protein